MRPRLLRGHKTEEKVIDLMNALKKSIDKNIRNPGKIVLLERALAAADEKIKRLEVEVEELKTEIVSLEDDVEKAENEMSQDDYRELEDLREIASFGDEVEKLESFLRSESRWIESSDGTAIDFAISELAKLKGGYNCL